MKIISAVSSVDEKIEKQSDKTMLCLSLTHTYAQPILIEF